MSDQLLFEKDGAIARVTLNRPEAFNAMNADIRRALTDAIAKIDSDPDVRVVILSGAGRGFCAGTDLTERHTKTTEDLLDSEYRPIVAGIAASPKIWIAQVHGSAAGIGAAVALNCDLVTMAKDASIYMAFAAIGLVPDGGSTWLLHRAMGSKHALQAILEARKIAAADALAYGLANAVHTEDALGAETDALATRLSAGAPLAAAAAKRLMRAMDEVTYDTAFSAEAKEQLALTASADAHEGISAFLQKRKPVFQGR